MPKTTADFEINPAKQICDVNIKHSYKLTHACQQFYFQ